MDISGINSKMVNNTIENAKTSAADGDFEARLKKAYDEQDKQALKKVCQDFESIMLNMMYKQMKASIPKSGLLNEDSGKEIFDSMLDDKLMENASKSGTVGLADMMYKQLSKNMDNVYKTSANTSGGEETKSEDKGDTEKVEGTK